MSTVVVDPSSGAPRAGVADRLRAQVAGLGDDALVERSREIAGEISAAEAALATVLAEIERRGVNNRWDCPTIERFAGWHCQLGAARSAGLAEVGRRMAELPVLAEAVSDGSLGFDKAKSIAKVADPSTEAALVDMARHATTNQTQRLCGKYRTVAERDATDPDEPDQPAPEPRPTVLVIHDDNGIELRVRFDHVRGQLVLASLEAATNHVRKEREGAAAPPGAETNPADGRPACAEDQPVEKLTTAEWRAEGLLRMAGAYTAAQPEDLQPTGFGTTVLVHVGIDTLYDLDTEAGEAGEGVGGPPPTGPPGRPDREQMSELEPSGIRIRRDIARMLACDADILTVIEDADGNPLHLGPRHSTIPARLRRAVMARYRTCVWPGCTATAVQLHHVHHRADGGHDDVEGLVPECLAHHWAIHADGISITRDADGSVHHWRPDGTEILANPHGRAGTDVLLATERLQAERIERGGDPSRTARQPLWQGDPLHLADAVDALLGRRDAALRRTKPTRPGSGGRFEHPPPNLN